MKICFLTKYPPIEGGVSSKAYWLARGLGKRGNKVFVVTNAWEVETEYREKMSINDLNFYQPGNVKVYNTDPFENPRYIPYAKPYTEKLASLAIEVIGSHDLQLIESSYILPYGISGYMAKSFMKVPQILKHAGSDITRLFNSPYLNSLFLKILQSADRIITNRSAREVFSRFGIAESKLVFDRFSIDTGAFNPAVKPFDLSVYSRSNSPVITFIGKADESKGIYELIDSLARISDDFTFLLVTGGIYLNRITKSIEEHKLNSKTVLLPFLPPWTMPSIIKASTCVVIPERDFPIKIHAPILSRECWALGTCTMLSKELYVKRPSKEIEDDIHTLTVNPRNITQFREKLTAIIKNPDSAFLKGKEAHKVSSKIENFNSYIEQREKLYNEVLR